MNWVDYCILALIVVSTLIGAVRGAIRETLGLATWLLAFWIAWLGVTPVAKWLSPHVADPTLQLAVAYGVLFLVTLLVGGLITALLVSLVRESRFSGTDRTLGGGIGLVRGIVIISIAILLSRLATELPGSPAWKSSFLIPRFEPLANAMQTLVPDHWLRALSDSPQVVPVSG